MKKIILIQLLLFSKISFSQCDTTGTLQVKDSMTRQYVLNINKNNYKGLTIEEVISKKELKDYCRKSYIQKIIGLLSGVDLSYNGFVTLRLFISSYDGKKFGNKPANWDFEKIKKCKILRVDVLDRN